MMEGPHRQRRIVLTTEASSGITVPCRGRPDQLPCKPRHVPCPLPTTTTMLAFEIALGPLSVAYLPLLTVVTAPAEMTSLATTMATLKVPLAVAKITCQSGCGPAVSMSQASRFARYTALAPVIDGLSGWGHCWGQFGATRRCKPSQLIAAGGEGCRKSHLLMQPFIEGLTKL